MRLLALALLALAGCATLAERRHDCESGDAAACLKASKQLRRNAIAHKPVEAQEYARRSCALGLADGCSEAAEPLICGRFELPRNDVEAARLYEAGCLLGDSDACWFAADLLAVDGPAFAPERAQAAARKAGCRAELRELCEPSPDFFTARAPLGPAVPVSSEPGGLKADEVGPLIKAHWGEIRRCYERELQCEWRLAGRVALTFQIGREGRVISSWIKESTLQSPAAEACIVAVSQRWRFPAPRGGVVVNVDYPFIFQSR